VTRTASRRFAAYLRVSTESQGRSGLGLEAQRQAVAVYLAQHGGELLAEFQEIESGRTAARPQLAAALACCRTRRAALLAGTSHQKACRAEMLARRKAALDPA